MTQMGTDREPYIPINPVTEKAIGCAFAVGKVLGPGFLEKVDENALVHEIRKTELRVEQQKRIIVWYDGVIVGDYVADIVVEGSALVEVKAERAIIDEHIAQAFNYLAATKLPVCLLLNFTKRVEIKRLAGPDAPRQGDSLPCPSVTAVAASLDSAQIVESADFDEA